MNRYLPNWMEIFHWKHLPRKDLGKKVFWGWHRYPLHLCNIYPQMKLKYFEYDLWYDNSRCNEYKEATVFLVVPKRHWVVHGSIVTDMPSRCDDLLWFLYNPEDPAWFKTLKNEKLPPHLPSSPPIISTPMTVRILGWTTETLSLSLTRKGNNNVTSMEKDDNIH